MEGGANRARLAAVHDGAPATGSDILALPHPDWLYQELTVTGPSAALSGFRRAAAGSGVVPWVYDHDQMEEDWFHLLLAPGSGQRGISFSGARILARQLRELSWERHEEAVSLVGVSRTCPLDFHSLVPVPREILRLGPDHPGSRAWLWGNWGTTWALRHVRALPPAPGTTLGATPGAAPAFRCGFWSADWTPWAALRAIAARWPALRFDLRVTY